MMLRAMGARLALRRVKESWSGGSHGGGPEEGANGGWEGAMQTGAVVATNTAAAMDAGECAAWRALAGGDMAMGDVGGRGG